VRGIGGMVLTSEIHVERLATNCLSRDAAPFELTVTLNIVNDWSVGV
jgi:hypothetical protein